MSNNILMSVLNQKSNDFNAKNKIIMDSYSIAKKDYEEQKRIVDKILRKITKLKIKANSIEKDNNDIQSSILSDHYFGKTKILKDEQLEQIKSTIRKNKNGIKIIKDEIKKLETSLTQSKEVFNLKEKEYRKVKSKSKKNKYQEFLDTISASENLWHSFSLYEGIIKEIIKLVGEDTHITIDYEIFITKNKLIAFKYLRINNNNNFMTFTPLNKEINCGENEYTTLTTDIISLSTNIDGKDIILSFYNFFRNIAVDDIHFETTLIEDDSINGSSYQLKAIYIKNPFSKEESDKYIIINTSIKTISASERSEEGIFIGYSKYPTRFK